jgi:hypothetical protein
MLLKEGVVPILGIARMFGISESYVKKLKRDGIEASQVTKFSTLTKKRDWCGKARRAIIEVIE